MKEKWFEQINNIANGDSAICPNCNSDTVHAVFRRIRGEYGYIVAWCESCKHGVNISRAKNGETFQQNMDIPDNLTFD